MRFIGIDPSTKTGFCALDEEGNVLRAKEITGIGDKDPKRMRTMIVDIVQHIQKGDAISIEGFGYASQQAVQNGGIGWGIRMALEGRGYQYTDVAPNALKKFVNVTGWTGEPGNKKRLSSKEKKTAVMRAVADHFGFTHKSDNVVDAYVLAQISRCIALNLSGLEPYQQEVIETILSPKPKNKRKAR